MMNLNKILRNTRNLKLALAYFSFLFIGSTYCTTEDLYNSSQPKEEYYDIFHPENLKIITKDRTFAKDTQNFTYYKCLCDIQQVWNKNVCVQKGTDVISPLLQSLHPDSEILFNFVFSSVNVQDVNCSAENISIELKEDNLYLLENGELYSEGIDLMFSPGNYCIEFIEDDDVFHATAKVCVPKPRVPFCPDEAVLDYYFSPLSLNVSYLNTFVNVQNVQLFKASKPQCGEDDRELKIPVRSNSYDLNFIYVSGNIELIWNPSIATNVPEVVSSDQYCMSENQGEASYHINLCYNDPIVRHEKQCSSSVCVRKCCPDLHIYDSKQRICVRGDDPTNSTIFQFYDSKNKSSIDVPRNVVVEYSFPWCPPHRLYVVDPTLNPSDKFYLLENGSLYLSLSDLVMPPSLYCVESFTDEYNVIAPKALSCFLENPKEDDQCQNVHRILYPILIVISCVFLGITLIVYALIPELHAKLHGKSLLSHVSSLLLAFLCQLIISWSSKSLSMSGCKIIALGNQVSFLWAFFWLNVMCFDIWWTLRTMSLVPETGERSRRRFTLYSAYAWGTPVVICLFTALMEFLPSSVDKSRLILPGFGVRGCWFQDAKSTWLYFHGFTLFLYVLNIFFFFHVAAILIKGQRSTEGILRTTWKQHKERVYLYLKLFVVMGITWVCEVASWQEGTCEYWIFTDIVNSLQGVMIFFIFMCNKKVFQKIQAKGTPLLRRIKDSVRLPSEGSGSGSLGITRASSSLQRTTQTSDESSSRRLSSSIPPPDNHFPKEV